MKTSTQFLLYLAEFFLEWEMFRTKFVENVKTHILFILFIVILQYIIRQHNNNRVNVLLQHVST